MPLVAPRLLALASLFALGCEEVDERPEFFWQGETIRYAADHPEALCGGTLEYLDGRASAMTDRVGGPDRIDYYWLDDIEPYCPAIDNITGCANEHSEAYAEEAALLHEIAHLRGGNSMPSMLEEGVAVHFGDPVPLETLGPREDFVDELYVVARQYRGDYSRAGHFAAFISETYGWETLLELDDALPRGAASEAVDAAFTSVVGMGLDDVVAVYADYPECLNIVDHSIACEAEPQGEYSDWGNVDYERVVDCASSTGVGPHGGWAFVEGTIELPDVLGGSRFFTMTGDGLAYGGAIALWRCGPCSEGGTVLIRESAVNVPKEEVPTGRYLVRLYVPANAGAVTIGVSVQ